VLIDVALVQLTQDPAVLAAGADLASLVTRVGALERAVAAATSGAAAADAPVDPSTGRAKLGGRAQRSVAAASPDALDAATGATTTPAPPASKPTSPSSVVATPNASATSPDAPGSPASPEGVAPRAGAASPTQQSASAAGVPAARDPAREWTDSVRPSLRGLARALFAPVDLVGHDGGVVTLSAPNATHQSKCVEHVADVQRVWREATGREITVAWQNAPTASPAVTPGGPTPPASTDREPELDDGDELDDSRPPMTGGESVLQRVAEAFPGAERIDAGRD
jgi:DNA polymerase-3 subunit gamma/tau